MTNADRIKNTTNKELAIMLSQDAPWKKIFFPKYCIIVIEGENSGFCDNDCYECVLEWLNQEVVKNG